MFKRAKLPDFIWKLYPDNSDGKGGFGRGAKIESEADIDRILESVRRDLKEWLAHV